mmetsp:Transcript_16084/g.41633  ORF Transcript_16084/g.41633 Transcript_16084/m.41633 type:complete len:210 (+) Transcript_16084:626-1255(+)
MRLRSLRACESSWRPILRSSRSWTTFQAISNSSASCAGTTTPCRRPSRRTARCSRRAGCMTWRPSAPRSCTARSRRTRCPTGARSTTRTRSNWTAGNRGTGTSSQSTLWAGCGCASVWRILGPTSSGSSCLGCPSCARSSSTRCRWRPACWCSRCRSRICTGWGCGCCAMLARCRRCSRSSARARRCTRSRLPRCTSSMRPSSSPCFGE